MAETTIKALRPFRWSEVVVPEHDLEGATPLNRQRMLRVLTTDPLGLADLIDAATVILLSRAAREALAETDPMALGQLETAMALSAPNLPNPFMDGQPVLFRDAVTPQYTVAHSMGAGDPRVAFVFGDGLSKNLMPWDYHVRPDDDPQAE